jgi:hypothetical protein
VRTEILQRADADIADWFNLACALLDAGYPARSWIEEVLSQVAIADPVYREALDMLALEMDDPVITPSIEAELAYLNGS